MDITLSIPSAFYRGSPHDENAETLKVLLDSLIGLNLVYLRYHPRTPALYRSGVVYGRTEVWDTIPALYAKRYGDCKSLTAAMVAQLRMAGTPAKPVFRFIENPSGALDFHILVQTAAGFEDPSKVLGMRVE